MSQPVEHIQDSLPPQTSEAERIFRKQKAAWMANPYPDYETRVANLKKLEDSIWISEENYWFPCIGQPLIWLFNITCKGVGARIQQPKTPSIFFSNKANSIILALN